MTSKAALLGSPRDWAIDFAVATGVGAFLGVVGPYGSFFNGPLGVRLAYWIGVTWIGAAVFGLAVRLSLAAGRRLNVPAWFMAAVAALLGAAAQAAIVAQVAVALWPHLKRFTPFIWYIQCLAISIPLVVAYLLMRPRLLGPADAPPAPISPQLPEPGPAAEVAGAPVLCLRMEDHYVRVHTLGGSRLVAGPFERVIDGMAQAGLRVNRSWWVARGAVTGVIADGRNLRLTLRGDLSAPVSRASVARLREAGWLKAEPSGGN
jgi:hypothetical protein